MSGIFGVAIILCLMVAFAVFMAKPALPLMMAAYFYWLWRKETAAEKSDDGNW